MQNLKRRITGLLLCLLCALTWLPTGAFAAGAIDTGKDVSLTIQYQYDNKAIPDAEFSVYLVGTVDAYGKIALTSTYAAYPISTDGLDAKGWNALALTLSGYVQRDKLPALDSGKTDANGVLKFPQSSSVSMKPGLYLVLGKTHTVGNYTYTAAPFLVFLPGENAAANDWSYSMTVNPKCERKHDSSDDDDDTITRKVLKIWDDKGYESKRPSEVVIQLLRDGRVYSTVTLNKDNNWRFTWNALSDKYTWTVTEKEVSGYTVAVSQEGVTFTVKNTFVPPADPPIVPPADPPTDPPTDPPIDPPTDPPQPPKPPQVPQTGQLWWPVPILALVGMCLIFVGVLKKRKCDRSYDAQKRND